MTNEDYIKALAIISAANARIEGMKAQNTFKEMRMEHPEYTYADFLIEAQTIESVIVATWSK